MIEDFHSLEELYKRVYPVLRMKVKEFQSLGYNNIQEEDIWKVLSETIWKKSNRLTLYDVTKDIFDCEIEQIMKEK